MANEYIKLFDTTSEYQAFTATTEYVKPNVSVCKDDLDNIHYNIKPKNISGAVITCDNAVYNGSVQIATNIVVTYNGRTLTNNTDYTVANNTGGTNVGDYTFTVNGVGKYEGSKQCTFTISKADGEVTIEPTAIDVEYDGEQHELITVGSGTGTMLYNLNGGEWGASIPTAIDEGTYVIGYKASASTNYNESASGSVIASISAPPEEGLMVVGTYNITSTDTSYRISPYDTITTIEIDGVKMPPYSSYKFSSTGNKTIKYELEEDVVSGFDDFSGLTSVNIPNGVTSIMFYSFRNCQNLSSVIIPDSVNYIDDGAFEYCTNLTNVNIPNNIEYVGGSAFDGTQVQTISNNLKYVNNWVVGEAYTESAYTINAGTVGISNKVFRYDSMLTGITIPNSVRYIGSQTFYECNRLKRINSNTDGVFNLPNGLTHIGADAFSNCRNATNINIPDSITDIGNSAFSYCQNLTGITIPTGAINIDWPFYQTSSCTISESGVTYTSDYKWVVSNPRNGDPVNGELRNEVVGIGEDAFHNSRILSLTVPRNVSYIDEAVNVNYNTPISSITVNSNNSVYDSRNNCNAIIKTSTNELVAGCKNTVIPSTVTSIGNNAFYYCSGLTSINIPSSVTSIGDKAFYYCSGLTSVTIPSSVTSIGDSAFYACSGLTSVTIPSSVTSIGNNTFTQCTGLTSVTIPSSVTSIGNSAFYYCSGLTSVAIPNNVKHVGNAAFSNCRGLTSVTIPNNVKHVGNAAFSNCSGLTSVTIESSSTRFCNKIFSGCTNLSNITMPRGTKIIGNGFFGYCASITNFSIPDSVEIIGNSAFYYCSGLTSISIPENVTAIGDSAFTYCSGLTSIVVNATTPPILGIETFDNTNNCPIYVPSGRAHINQRIDGAFIQVEYKQCLK